jgi:hypothetical protein
VKILRIPEGKLPLYWSDVQGEQKYLAHLAIQSTLTKNISNVYRSLILPLFGNKYQGIVLESIMFLDFRDTRGHLFPNRGKVETTISVSDPYPHPTGSPIFTTKNTQN